MITAMAISRAETMHLPRRKDSSAVEASAQIHDAQHPYLARVAANRPLNRPGSDKDTRHLVVDLDRSGISYAPGDSLGIVPCNHPALVDRVLAASGFRADETVQPKHGGETPLRQFLISHDITRLPKSLIRLVGGLYHDPRAEDLLADRAALDAFTKGRDVLDFFEHFADLEFAPQQVANCLHPLRPRLYSVASSLAATPATAELCIAIVRWESHGRTRLGVCSTYACERVALGERMPVYVHHAKHFRLTDDDDRPIIMVGPGTGIAPFRAFLQERRARNARGRNWLFFGDRHRETDYLYGDELTAMHEDGLLARVDLAFSRDQEHKIYVQDRIRENGAEFWRWLEDGAILYVCGDAVRMAKDVHRALLDVVAEHGGMDEDGAAAYVKKMQTEKRYQRDVY